ncbi:hypothetical protein M5K25_022261 [Dendrobium thyrsiflorum]|uniref:NADH dehydrogenase [ubiquinone] 1 beta subcomplex subunit 9 n=1 Tax=Dendrobium thyrsiflorum TaxID=117978 RepID=A0ABD0UBY3_DENTH
MGISSIDEADELRAKFDANKHVEDLDTIDRLINEAEASYEKWQHPDPYIVPWAPGGSKFTRNPVPPQGVRHTHGFFFLVSAASAVIHELKSLTAKFQKFYITLITLKGHVCAIILSFFPLKSLKLTWYQSLELKKAEKSKQPSLSFEQELSGLNYLYRACGQKK